MVLGHPTALLQVLLTFYAALWQHLASTLFWVPFSLSKQINEVKTQQRKEKYKKILFFQIILLYFTQVLLPKPVIWAEFPTVKHNRLWKIMNSLNASRSQ